MREISKSVLIIAQSVVIVILVLVGNHTIYNTPKYDQPSDYAIELQNDGTVRVKTDHGLDTTLVTLDSLEEFIEADNL